MASALMADSTVSTWAATFGGSTPVSDETTNTGLVAFVPSAINVSYVSCNSSVKSFPPE